MPTNRKICFVIMPFGKTTKKHTQRYWSSHFGEFLKPLIEENPSLEAQRSSALRGQIVKDIVNNLFTSPIVVADLTDTNPNVYWELGIRQTFQHGTVTIAQAGTKLPFDISGKGTLFYYPNALQKMNQFREPFKQALQDCLDHPERADSVVLESIVGRGTFFESFRRDETIRRIDGLLAEMSTHMGLLDVLEKSTDQKMDNIMVDRFATGAIELLANNRYLDEPKPFYGLVIDYLQNILGLDTLLEIDRLGRSRIVEGVPEERVKAISRLRNFYADLAQRLEIARTRLLNLR